MFKHIPDRLAFILSKKFYPNMCICHNNTFTHLDVFLPSSIKQKIIKLYIMAQEFTDANFKTEVLDSDKLSVIDFWAEWCGPCRAIGPVIEDLSKEYAGKVKVGKVNVDHNPQVSMNYGITSIPAILFVKNGQVVDKLVGAQPKGNFVKKIEQHM
jgi:thioredoxin 1